MNHEDGRLRFLALVFGLVIACGFGGGGNVTVAANILVVEGQNGA